MVLISNHFNKKYFTRLQPVIKQKKNYIAQLHLQQVTFYTELG